MRENLMTTREAAKFLRLNPITVQTKARNNALPALRIGNRWRFKQEDLEGYLNNAQPATPAKAIVEGEL